MAQNKLYGNKLVPTTVIFSQNPQSSPISNTKSLNLEQDELNSANISETEIVNPTQKINIGSNNDNIDLDLDINKITNKNS